MKSGKQTRKSSHQTIRTDMQGADVERRPSGPVDRVVAGSRALSRSLLLRRYPGLLGLDALRAVEHHLDHGVLHQGGEAKQQASDEPDVDGLDVGHFGQLGGQGGALGGQREHREDAWTRRWDKQRRSSEKDGVLCFDRGNYLAQLLPRERKQPGNNQVSSEIAN